MSGWIIEMLLDYVRIIEISPWIIEISAWIIGLLTWIIGFLAWIIGFLHLPLIQIGTSHSDP